VSDLPATQGERKEKTHINTHTIYQPLPGIAGGYPSENPIGSSSF